MKLTQYVCTHCGKQFEAEEKEILECPGCFWSTSVKKAEDAEPRTESPAQKKSAAASFEIPKGLLRFFIGVLMALAAAIIFLKVLPSVKESLKKRPGAVSGITIPPDVKPAASRAPAVPAGEVLTAEEKEMLSRKLEVKADRPLSPDEESVLNHQAPLKAGFIEKLPFQAWNLELFKQVLSTEEKRYKVPLPGSYHRKLENLFKEKYLPGAEAFKNEKLLEARNFWAESLAFPVYSTNIQKHRAVALTMLRPFINDTLSKIGTLNSILAERSIREREMQVTAEYGKILEMLHKKNWPEALAAMTALDRKLSEMITPAAPASVEPYPPGVNQVDDTIRGPLMDLLSVPPPALSDLEPLRADLRAKERVVQGLIPANVESAQTLYNEAFDLIQKKEWESAAKKLGAIEFPDSLVADARAKIKIIEKLKPQSGTLETK